MDMNSNTKTGLVLEGGGLRSLFSEGVFDVMLEHGVTFDGMIGVSAGASIGCNFKSKQIGRALRYNTNFADDPRYVGLRSLLTTGDIIGAEFAYHVLPFKYDLFDWDTWNANPMEFHLVTTDVNTGEPIYRKIDEMTHDGLDWMRASSSMPIVSRPVELDGYKMLDGGITDSIPLKHFQQIGFAKNVVVLTQPKGYFKTKTKLMPLFHLFCHKYPKIIEAMARRHEMYNAQLEFIAEQERLGNIIIICPDDTIPIGRVEMNTEKMKVVYEMGRKAGLENIEKIKEFIR